MCKWCIDFDFDVQNFHLKHHLSTQFFVFKLVERKLHSAEVLSDSETLLVQMIWANDTFSWQEYFPVSKNKVCMSAWCRQHSFKFLLFGLLNKGKMRSSESAASSEVEAPQCKQLSMSDASGHSCMRLNRYLNHSGAHHSNCDGEGLQPTKIQGQLDWRTSGAAFRREIKFFF